MIFLGHLRVTISFCSIFCVVWTTNFPGCFFFQKQLKVSKGKTTTNTEGTFKNSSIPSAAGEALDHSEAGANGQQQLESSEPVKERKKLADRMRIPVSYDDLLEEGEIPP